MAFQLLVASQFDNTEILLGTVYFDTASTTLTPNAEIDLKRIADTLLAARNLLIDVRGYAHPTGSSSKNIALSQEMADRVRDYLITNLDIAGDRIRAYGLGLKDSIVMNQSEKDKTKRSRVEILVRQPDALLTSFENDVKVQPPFLRPGWLEPIPNYYLYRGYKVTTGRESSAHIIYPNQSTLAMGAEAIVMIQGLNLDRKEESPVNNIEVQRGSLNAMLRDAASQDDSAMSGAPADMGKLNSRNGTTFVDEKLESLVVAYESDTEVSVPNDENASDIGEAVVMRQDTDALNPVGFGLGLTVGEPTGVSVKSWLAKKQAIDLEIGWSFPGERIHIATNYLFHFPEWIKKGSWYPYLGIGGRLKMTAEQDEEQFRFGIRFGVGIEYVYRQFGISAGLFPVVDMIPQTRFGIEGGIGVRYYFKGVSRCSKDEQPFKR